MSMMILHSLDEKQAVSQEVKLLSDLHHTNIVQYKVGKATVITLYIARVINLLSNLPPYKIYRK